MTIDICQWATEWINHHVLIVLPTFYQEFFEFETVPLPKKGKLLTFTTVHNLPPDFNVAKLGLGIVELENGMRITGQHKIPQPKLGMPVIGKVEIVREAEYSKNYGMVFYPA